MIRKTNAPFKQTCPVDFVMSKIFKESGFTGTLLRPRVFDYNGDDYETVEFQDFTKLPDAKSYYITEPEIEEFVETQVSINLREMTNKYVNDCGGSIDMVEFATFIWNEAIGTGKIVMLDNLRKWTAAKQEMATRYVNKRMDSFLINVQTKSK